MSEEEKVVRLLVSVRELKSSLKKTCRISQRKEC